MPSGAKQYTFLSIGECMVELSGGTEGLFRMGFAGDTLNTAWYARAHLSDDWDVAYFTAIGDDRYSRAMAAFLDGNGISTHLIQTIPGKRPGLYIIHQEGGDRHFTYWRDSSAARGLAADAGALARAFAGAGLIHLSGITLAILPADDRDRLFTALAQARAEGARVSFDPNIRPRLWASLDEVRRVVPQALALTDIALPSFDDEVAVWGDADPQATIARLAAAGVAECAVKDGAGPITVWADGAIRRIATPPVQGIRDTTGAGDSFNAGYLAARLLEQPPDQAVAAGQRFSGMVIQHFGARLPSAMVPVLA